MHRALQLATGGRGHVSPNPMVGAVIVADGRIIGEGYHRRFGGPHAEVNAIDSVRDDDRHLLKLSTMYVTLEPCSHYGKTPPCARLIMEKGIPKVIVGALDTFPKVSGKGVEMLRKAGVRVTSGVLREECEELNVRFMTSHRLGRPFIELKWAQTADGYMAGVDGEGAPTPLTVSNPLTMTLMHADRAMADAVMVGTNTVVIDNPRLNLRLWPGRDPLRVTFDRKGELDKGLNIFRDGNYVIPPSDLPLEAVMADLYQSRGVTSIIVEGGPLLLSSFINRGLWDRARIEISPVRVGKGVKAPEFDYTLPLISSVSVRDNIILTYKNERE